MNIYVHVCIDYNPLIKACVIFLCNRSFCPKLLVIYCTYLELCGSLVTLHMFFVHALNMKLKLLFGAMVTSAITKFFIKCFVIIFIYRCSLLFSFTKI